MATLVQVEKAEANFALAATEDGRKVAIFRCFLRNTPLNQLGEPLYTVIPPGTLLGAELAVTGHRPGMQRPLAPFHASRAWIRSVPESKCTMGVIKVEGNDSYYVESSEQGRIQLPHSLVKDLSKRIADASEGVHVYYVRNAPHRLFRFIATKVKTPKEVEAELRATEEAAIRAAAQISSAAEEESSAGAARPPHILAPNGERVRYIYSAAEMQSLNPKNRDLTFKAPNPLAMEVMMSIPQKLPVAKKVQHTPSAETLSKFYTPHPLERNPYFDVNSFADSLCSSLGPLEDENVECSPSEQQQMNNNDVLKFEFFQTPNLPSVPPNGFSGASPPDVDFSRNPNGEETGSFLSCQFDDLPRTSGSCAAEAGFQTSDNPTNLPCHLMSGLERPPGFDSGDVGGQSFVEPPMIKGAPLGPPLPRKVPGDEYRCIKFEELIQMLLDDGENVEELWSLLTSDLSHVPVKETPPDRCILSPKS